MAKQQDTSVLFIWEVRDRLREYLTEGLKGFPEVKLIFPPDTEENTLLEHVPEANIIVGWRPTEKLLERAEKLSLFINPGAGVQHIVPLFRNLPENRLITLVNGHGNSYFAAQHAVAMLLALTNHVIPHHLWMKAGEWRKGDDDAISIPLRDRAVGFLGYGAVNNKVHQFLSGFAVSFAALRRDWQVQRGYIPTMLDKYDASQLHEFLAAIDILIIAVPQTAATAGLIGKKEIALLGSDALVVNVARGIVVDEKEFYEALKNRTIAGAAIDVWYEYRPDPDKEGKKYPFNHPFHELENVILSPHRAASPFNDLKRWDEVIENISRFAKGSDDFLNVVDIEREY
jgi:phosphoglycerate dehydrogenase-like enzyme